MSRLLRPALLCSTFLFPACGGSDGEGGEDETTASTTLAETETESESGEQGGDGDGELTCEVQFVAIAAGLDAAGGDRPCGVAYGAEADVGAEAAAECGPSGACHVQQQATPGYCGIMVMSPDATQAWPGVTEACTPDELQAMLLSQCKTAAGGIDCEVRCIQCGEE